MYVKFVKIIIFLCIEICLIGYKMCCNKLINVNKKCKVMLYMDYNCL